MVMSSLSFLSTSLYLSSSMGRGYPITVNTKLSAKFGSATTAAARKCDPS